MIYFILLVGLYCLSLLLKLNWFMTLLTGIYIFLIQFAHRKLYRNCSYEEQRFYDASLYMDTVLYAFLKEKKIFQTFKGVSETLKEGELKALVEEAWEHMMMTDEETKVYEDAMGLIYSRYRCQRIANIHSFMIHVEYFGGDIKDSVELLLDDKNRWSKRITELMEDRHRMFREIIMSVAVSLVICGMILYLPIMNVDISGNWIVQILGFLVVVLDDLIILKAQKELCADYLMLDALDDDSYYEKKLKEYQNYNPQKARRLSILLSIFPAIGIGIAGFLGKRWLAAGLSLILIIFINQHTIGRNLAKKSLTRFIKSAFPKWLLDLSLLLQSENVYMALVRSRDMVPGVLRGELEDLISKIEIDPESSSPYYDFLKDFQIPEVSSAVGILYGISTGNSGGARKQIKELVSRNLTMLDISDRERLKNKNSSMYLLFLAPILTASLKLVVDMAVFLITFLSTSVVR